MSCAAGTPSSVPDPERYRDGAAWLSAVGRGGRERLIGMYAVALWDARVEKLVMIRDRLGVKPFSLSPTSDGVLFGSEPKAILANPLAERAVDLDGLRGGAGVRGST